MNRSFLDWFQGGAAVPTLSLWQLLGALTLSTVLTVGLALLYMRTHSGVSYSKSFVQTIVLFGVTISLVIMLIGASIARAFAVVGALSVIRFRNPVKDPRDVAFLFGAMAIGMACGANFPMFAVAFAIFLGGLIVMLHALRFGDVASRLHVLRVRMQPDNRGPVEEVCRQMCRRYSVVAIDHLAGGDSQVDVMYEIMLKRSLRYEELVKQLGQIGDDISVSLLVGDGHVTV